LAKEVAKWARLEYNAYRLHAVLIDLPAHVGTERDRTRAWSHRLRLTYLFYTAVDCLRPRKWLNADTFIAVGDPRSTATEFRKVGPR
jgi:hypothetical protein